jgi:VWFA-related protein
MRSLSRIKHHRFSTSIPAQRLLPLLVALLFLVACGGGGTGGSAQHEGASAVSDNDNNEASEGSEITLSINQLAQDSCPQGRAYVSVTDADGKPIEALTTADFSIFAGGEPAQDVQVQWAPEAFAPVSVSFVMDYSGSMDVDAVDMMEAAATTFVDRMAAEDWGEVIKFALVGEIVQAYTPNKEALKSAIAEPWAFSGSITMLYDAVHRAVADTALRDGRRAVLAITDGVDNASQHSLDEVIAYATDQQVPIFTVGLNQADTESLAQLAAGTGGRYFYAPDPSALSDIYVQLAALLEHQYVITYRYGTAGDLAHTIEVIAESEGQVAGDILRVDGCPAPPSLELAGELATDGSVLGLDSEADHLYLANGSAGLAIVDVSDPSLPVLESELSTLADASGFAALDVAVAAPYAFIAAGEDGLIIADISAVDDPQIVATIAPNFNDPDASIKMTAFSKLAVYAPFIFALDEADGLVVFLFETPERIYYQVETGVVGRQLWVSGRHLYITTPEGLSIFDIGNPSDPELVGQASIDGGCEAITLAYPYLYASLAADAGVAVIDVSQETAPTVLGSLLTAAPVLSLGTQSGFAFAGGANGDLSIVDVRQPSAPEIHSQVAVGGSIGDVAMTSDWIYVAAGDAGLQVLKIAH